MENVNNIKLTILIWAIAISCVLILIGVNYLFVKLGILSTGWVKYGVIKSVINPRELIVETKFAIFWKKNKNITVRYMDDSTENVDMEKLKKFLIGQTIAFSKVNNMFDVINFKNPMSIIKYVFKGGNTYDVSLLDVEFKNKKFIPKSIIPYTKYPLILAKSYNCKIRKDDILGYFDNKLYSEYIK